MASTRRRVPKASCLCGEWRHGHCPPLTILGDKLGGDSCLKCGKNWAVVTCHDVTGAAYRGGKAFLSREGQTLLVKPRIANPWQKSTRSDGSLQKGRGFSPIVPLTFHHHAQKSQ